MADNLSHYNRITVSLGDNCFIITAEYSNSDTIEKQEYSCPFSYFFGKDYKYRYEVVSDAITNVGLVRTSTVLMTESAVEKIDNICQSASTLF